VRKQRFHAHQVSHLRPRRWHRRRRWRRVGGGNRGGGNRSGRANRCWQRLRRHWRRDNDSGYGGGTDAGAPASSILVRSCSPKQRKSAEALALGRSSSPSGSSVPANRDPPLQRADGGDGHDLGSPCRGGVR